MFGVVERVCKTAGLNFRYYVRRTYFFQFFMISLLQFFDRNGQIDKIKPTARHCFVGASRSGYGHCVD